jgi:hypothetical protein
MEENNNYPKWGYYIVAKLDDIHEDVHQNSIEIAKLKLRAGVWGLVGSLCALGVFAAVSRLF